MVEPVPGAAAFLGISRQRVLQLIQSGDLEAVKIGKDWFVSSLSLQERRNERQTASRKNEQQTASRRNEQQTGSRKV